MNILTMLAAAIAALGLTMASAEGQIVLQGQHATATSFLGVMIQEVGSDRARELKLPEEAGVEITRVDPNSPAASAGLMTGDVVLQYGGQKVEGLEQFSRLVRETPAGREVKLQIFRSGGAQTVTAKIASRPGPPLVLPAEPFNFRLPDTPRDLLSRRSNLLGIEGEPLNGQLADYFGVKDGVLVRSVAKNSAAEKAGIKAGDVITRVGDSKVSTPADITSHLRTLRGQSVPVAVTRERREMTLSVAIEINDGSQKF
jgi:serine protease Do